MKKYCSYCKTDVDSILFSKNRKEKDGLNRQCKPCQKLYYQANKTKIIARVKSNADPIAKKEYDKNRRAAQGERLRAYDRIRNADPLRVAKNAQWIKDNPQARKVISARYAHNRRSGLIYAKPNWWNEFDDFVFEEAILLCSLREQVTKTKWELDHIIPLRGKKVCGLHTASNFSVVPMLFNRKKLNKFPYHSWTEWKRVT